MTKKKKIKKKRKILYWNQEKFLPSDLFLVFFLGGEKGEMHAFSLIW